MRSYLSQNIGSHSCWLLLSSIVCWSLRYEILGKWKRLWCYSMDRTLPSASFRYSKVLSLVTTFLKKYSTSYVSLSQTSSCPFRLSTSMDANVNAWSALSTSLIFQISNHSFGRTIGDVQMYQQYSELLSVCLLEIIHPHIDDLHLRLVLSTRVFLVYCNLHFSFSKFFHKTYYIADAHFRILRSNFQAIMDFNRCTALFIQIMNANSFF